MELIRDDCVYISRFEAFRGTIQLHHSMRSRHLVIKVFAFGVAGGARCHGCASKIASTE